MIYAKEAYNDYYFDNVQNNQDVNNKCIFYDQDKNEVHIPQNKLVNVEGYVIERNKVTQIFDNGKMMFFQKNNEWITSIKSQIKINRLFYANNVIHGPILDKKTYSVIANILSLMGWPLVLFYSIVSNVPLFIFILFFIQFYTFYTLYNFLYTIFMYFIHYT